MDKNIKKSILVIGVVILFIMISCASPRLNEPGADRQGLPLPKATTCFTHHVTDSATYLQCF